jgi:hypothetical protein
MTTKTKTATKKAKDRNPSRKARTAELPLGAIHEIADWLFDLGVRNADGDREGKAAVQRVRKVAHAAIDGRAYRISERDLLTAISLIVTAAERDLGVPGLSEAMATSFDIYTLNVDTAPIVPRPLTRCSATARPVVRVPTLPLATCPHRGPLVAPSLRCVP